MHPIHRLIKASSIEDWAISKLEGRYVGRDLLPALNAHFQRPLDQFLDPALYALRLCFSVFKSRVSVQLSLSYPENGSLSNITTLPKMTRAPKSFAKGLGVIQTAFDEDLQKRLNAEIVCFLLDQGSSGRYLVSMETLEIFLETDRLPCPPWVQQHQKEGMSLLVSTTALHAEWGILRGTIPSSAHERLHLRQIMGHILETPHASDT